MAQLTVFISYRRSDTRADAGRIYDALTRRLGREDVFMDVDTVRPGQDWVRAIEDAIERSDVVLALIGEGWLNAPTPQGLRRLDDPSDRVRLELEAALAQNKPIVPLLIDGARMPAEDDLPPSITALARYQAIGINHATFSSDLARLNRALRSFGQADAPAKRERPSGRQAAGRAAEAVTRGFLFADLRGYSSYVERNGDDAGAALLDRYRRLVREVVARHAGAEVKTEGDSFYVLFPSASTAVSAGMEIVADAAGQNAEHPDAPIQVGVGIHAGETAETAEGPVGSAVNIAARICAQAQAGEVLVSDVVRGLTRTRQVGTFEPAGARRLKGIAEPVTLYRVLPPGTAAAGLKAARISRTSSVSGDGTMPWAVFGVVVAFAIIAIGVGVVYFMWSGGGPGATPSAPAGSATPTTGAHATDPAGTQTPTSVASATASALVPTGTRVIYSRQVLFDEARCDDFPLDAKLYVLDPGDPGAPPYRLTGYSNLIEMDPTWSADGTRIGFIGSILRGPGGISWVGADGEDASHLLPPRGAPGVSSSGRTTLTIAPDASALVIGGSDMIWRVAPGLTEAARIHGVDPEVEPEPTELFRDVAYRADGKLLVLGSAADDTDAWLAVLSGDGTARQMLDLNLADLTGRVSRIAVGPDDDLLALQVDVEPESHIFVGRISRGMDDFKRLPMTIELPRDPRVSPDGTQLIVRALADGREQLFVVDIASGEATQLTHDADASACLADWRAVPPNLAQPRPAPQPADIRRFELGKLDAATYRDDLIDPDLTLTFGDGWFLRRNYVDGFSAFKPEAPGEVDFARLQAAPADACGEGAVVMGGRPSDLITYLQGRGDLELTNVGPVNLGGYTGLSVTVQGRAGEGCGETESDEYWALWPSGEDSFSLGPGEGLWLTALDVRGTTVSFLVFGPADTLDEYRSQHAQPLLQTVAFPED